MRIEENLELAPYTTFHIGGKARYFSSCENMETLQETLAFAKEKNLPVFVLGGGSNALISDEGFSGLVIHPMILGIAVVSEDAENVVIKVGAGEYWDRVAEYAVLKNWWGVENMSHIPGNSGALVVQNVGAYGQEASEVVEYVEVLNMGTGELGTFTNAECKFTYRHSIFNTAEKNKYIILSVVLKLKKNGLPNLSYGDVKKYFGSKEKPTISEIRQAIIEIRDKKYPFPKGAINGNAGSFFRGRVLSVPEMTELEHVVEAKFGLAASQRLESMQNRLRVAQGFKMPTAYLIELCGLKGFALGPVKVNENQPASLLNSTGEATAKDVLAMAEHVLKTVKDAVGVELEIEPELVGFNDL